MRQAEHSDITRQRYDRVAFFYDLFESPFESLLFSHWRSMIFDRIQGEKILEVGIGTGKNLPYYPRDIHFTGIDISTRMLERAKRRALSLKLDLEILNMDAQHLEFPEHMFDTVLATFVFCSVQDPILGLRELKRVCKPGGKLLLLEHMRPRRPIFGFLFDFINPIVVRMMGANINRKTIENIRKTGWDIRIEQRLASDIVMLIEASYG